MEIDSKIEAVKSYAIGGSGVGVGLLTWKGIVSTASDLTTIIGLLTAFVGLIIVSLRLYRDLTRKNK